MPKHSTELSKAILLKEKALAQTRALQAAALAGKLIEKDLAVATWATTFASLRDRCMALADRVAARGAQRSADELRAIVSEEVRDMLSGIAHGEF